MTALVDFLAGNAIALVVVLAVGILALVVFTLGGESRHRAMPTHPITTAAGLRADGASPAIDSTQPGDDNPESTGTEPVAVVGQATCESAVTTPFVHEPAVAYEIAVSGPFGYVATVRDATQFSLDVDGERVRVDVTSLPASSRPELDDDRREQTLRRLRGSAIDDSTRTTLRKLDGFRTRRDRLLSGRILPGLTTRTYRLRAVTPGDEVAVVGHLERDGDDYVLRAPADSALRILRPGTVTRHH